MNAAGRILVSGVLGVLCLLWPALLSSAPAGATRAGSTYIIRFDRWSDVDERDYSEFVSSIGKSGCNTVDACLHGPGNPFRASDPPDTRFYSDCANLPYVLRAYFAWKRGLPFSYASGVAPRGSSSDIRYSMNGNQITGRTDVLTGSTDGYSLLRTLISATSSAPYRVHPALETPREPDFYSVALAPKSIRPGTIIYDPDGHVAVVYQVERDGRIQFMDAHPDNTMTRGYYDLRFVRGPPAVGGGFKNWRPMRLEGYTRRGDGVLTGGHVVLASNSQIPDFSDEQYYGNGPRTGDAGWASGTFTLNGEAMDYYDYVRAKVAGGKLEIEPVAELTDSIRSICSDLHDRAQAVDLAIAAGIQNRPEPNRLPPNIYGTSGDWETYSTPSRDARLKTSFKELRDKAQRYVEMYSSGDPHLVYAGRDLVADLIEAYDREVGRCGVSYTKTNGTSVSLPYEEVHNRLFKLSFDPYQCIERRWGATDPNELATCRDGPDKQAWYAAEQNLRNQIDRTYEARMDFTRDQLLTPGPGKGVAQAPDTDARAYLLSVRGTQRGTPRVTRRMSVAAAQGTLRTSPASYVRRTANRAPDLESWRRQRELQFAEWQRSRPSREVWDAPFAPRMTVIPSGSFMMGSPPNETGRRPHEGPQHRVTIGYDLAVSTYPITFDEWDQCVAEGGCNRYSPYDERWGRHNRPVINVSWDDVQSYLAWLSAKTGYKYRLLSEAEFEYAMRAGTTTPYPTGQTITVAQANFLDPLAPAGDSGVSAGTQTLPVGSFPPNAFGLYDMQGNVWEWLADCWSDSYAGHPSDGSAWLRGDCQRRVVRGGAFNRDRNYLRSAYRLWIVAQLRSALAGFRVARAL